MRIYARLAIQGLTRSARTAVVRLLVLAVSVALLAAVLLFVGGSLATMADSAVRSVPVDWQGPVPTLTRARTLADAVGREPGVAQASAVAVAPFAGVEHQAAGVGTIRSAAGAILALPPDYQRHLQTFRFLQGGLRPGQIVLDQQLAATMQATVGDTVSLIPRAGVAAEPFRVSGVALVTAPDLLFQPLDPTLGPAPAQPPANIALMPLDTFASAVAPHLPTVGDGTGLAGSNLPVGLAGTQWQVQVQLDPGALGTGPAAALKLADQTRNRVERRLPGQVRFVDNLSQTLTTATEDALYAQALYIMLVVPGVLVALGLAYLAALGTVERDRQALALLRARGASQRGLLVLALTESSILGLGAAVVGMTAGWASVRLLVPGAPAPSLARLVGTALVCLAVGVGGAIAARQAAAHRAMVLSVFEARSSARRSTAPLWQRFYLDVLALLVSGLIYWLTAKTGFAAVVNPDANPTLSLAVYMFFAPALLWVGATLLLARLRGRGLSWLLARQGTPSPGRLRGFLLASAGRRGPAINRGLVVVGLLLAFGVELGIFAATYDRQALIDAQLTLGADVVTTVPPGGSPADGLEHRIAAVRGVGRTTAVDHSYAYVGPDLQDTYGIDATTLPPATGLRDSYFGGERVGTVLDRLRRTPDGILVAQETIADYQLKRGDLLKLRVLDHRSGRFVVADFHVVGTVLEFPSAPKDSFMVANLAYLQAITHDPGPNVVFASTTQDPRAVAVAVRQATARDGVTVKDIRAQTATTASSITAVDMSGIARIEETFIVLLAGAAMALYISVSLGERRRELGVMLALGASLRIAGAFLWSEAALILAAGLALAAGLGWLLSVELVAMLTHVFDPPPDALAIPWGFLARVAGTALLATLLAAAVSAQQLNELSLGEILRE